MIDFKISFHEQIRRTAEKAAREVGRLMASYEVAHTPTGVDC